MNSLLLWIAGIAVAALTTLSAAPHFIDWNRHREVVQAEASRVLGRQVRMSGNMVVRFLPVPYVQFEKIKIAGAAQDGADTFFRADGFTVWLSIGPLLRGAIEAREIELKNPALMLRVEADGGLDWRSFRMVGENLRLAPTEVTLQSVKIRNGAVVVRSADDQDLAVLDAIDGELSSDGLAGPYKFRGDLKFNGQPRDVRLSTAAPDAQGRIRLKLAVRAITTGSAYTLDGMLFDLTARPRFEGEIAARTPLSGVTGRTAASTGQRPVKDTGDSAALDLKARVAADTSGARLSEIALSFEQEGNPQLVSGTVAIAWPPAMQVNATLDSRWLDLDRFVESGQAAGPLTRAHAVLLAMVAALPGEGQVRVSLQVDQVNLGGDAISGFSVVLVRSEGDLRIEQFGASLPGAARIDLGGTIPAGGEADSFVGTLLLRGANLTRFIGWLTKNPLFAEPKSGRSFSLQATLRLAPDVLEFADAVATLDGALLFGRLQYGWAGRHRITAGLEGKTLDLSGILPAALTPAGFRSLFWPVPQSAGGEPWLDPANSDVAVRLRTETLSDGENVWRDVDMDVTLKNGKLTITTCKLVTDAGLAVEIEGTVANAAGKVEGALRGLVSAADEAAVSDLRRLADAAGLGAGEYVRAADLAPLRLAGTFTFGAVPSFDVDGMIQGSRVTIAVRGGGDLRSWRSAAVDAMIDVSSPDIARILHPVVGKGRPGSDAPTPGRLFLKAVGTPAEGLVLLAKLESQALNLTFGGTVVLPAAGQPQAMGELSVEAPDGANAIHLAGWRPPAGLRGSAVAGALDVDIKTGVWSFAPRTLTIAGRPISGHVSIAPEAERTKFDARLAVSAASVPGLLGFFLDERAGRADAQEAGPWPNQPFDFTAIDRLAGRLKLEVGTLTLHRSLALKRARLEADIDPAQVKVIKLDGEALGGQASATFALSRNAAGGALAADVRLAGLQLAALGPHKPSPAGTISLTLAASGRGATPLALISALQGKGEADIAEARIPGLSPQAVAAVADAILAGKFDPNEEDVAREIAARLGSTLAPLGSFKVPIDVVGGNLRVRDFTRETPPHGRIANRTTMEIVSFKVDSEWRLEANVPPQHVGVLPRTQLPPVTVVYAGPLEDVVRLEAKIDTGALEREIETLKMERNLRDLEQARRRDEEQAQQPPAPPGSPPPAPARRPHEPAAEQPKSADPPAAGVVQPSAGAPPKPQPPDPRRRTPPPPRQDGKDPLMRFPPIER
ncbi:MAG: AsmA family protein [Hyphomicrobiaceae bacterium]